MGTFKRALLAAAAAACTLASASGIAGATTPDPYSTSTATGRITLTTGLGPSICSLSGINSSIASNIGQITAVTVTGCSGSHRLTGTLPVFLTFDLTTVNPRVTVYASGFTFASLLGGTCLYTGTLTGTGSDATGDISVSGNVTLNTGRSTGVCGGNVLPAALQVTFPGLSL